jgi:AP-2 complex subunit beta-1
MGSQGFLVLGQLCEDKTGSCVEGSADTCAGWWKDGEIMGHWLTQIQDMQDSNPLVRALALRTISYVHVKEFVLATVDPLKQLLKDSDPYVRKTAAFCVAKLYDHDRTLVEASDLIDRLNTMLRDENPTVVSSALAALMDIWERSESIKLTIDYASASKIVQILPDCSE